MLPRALVLLVLLAGHSSNLAASALTGPRAVYTRDPDFDQGTSINVIHDPSDQLQLDGETKIFSYLWVAVSSKGTVVKIDTVSGRIVGEYHTAPQGMGLDPSRTTVDHNGSVWVANRGESGRVDAGAIAPGIPAVAKPMGSVVHIGLLENGQCVDRNGNGRIETSTGPDDVRRWSNARGADRLGGVSTAEDECIIHFTRVNSFGTRHLSVNAENNVWVSGTGSREFDLLDGTTGKIIRQEGSVQHGGYGGLIDGDGVIWSANPFMRWDTALPLRGRSGRNWTALGNNYGLCIDSRGNVWSTWRGNISKYAPDGTRIGTYHHGGGNSQGCVVDHNNHVWVAHSLMGGQTVGHLLNDGTYVGNVTVGNGPTGVALDAAGKIWATNFHDRTVSRIDPSAGPRGRDRKTRIGKVDFTSIDLGGNPYNYSDMTGSTLRGAPEKGTWSVVHDTERSEAERCAVSWTSDEAGGSSISVAVSGGNDGVDFGAEEDATSGRELKVASGRYLKIDVRFTRGQNDADADGVRDSPILYDLSLACGAAVTPRDSGAEPRQPVDGEQSTKPQQSVDDEQPTEPQQPAESRIETGAEQPAPSDIGTERVRVPAEVPPPPPARIDFGPPRAIDLGAVPCESESGGQLDLSAAKIDGRVRLAVSTNYEVPGTALEIDFGNGWIPLRNKPQEISVEAADSRSWAVRLRVGRCPKRSAVPERPLIRIEQVGAGGASRRTVVPLSLELPHVSWLECWWPILAILAGLLLIGFVIHGFWVPARFPPRLGVVLSPEEDMAEGFFHPIRAQRGSGSGFYRDARIYVCEDFRLSSSRRGAVARLRAHATKTRIEPLATVWRRSADDRWEQLPPQETTAPFGVVFKNDLGTLFFEIRTG